MQESALSSQAYAALRRGDRGALALFDQALRSDPGNAHLWLGKARALGLNGDRKGARIVAQQLAQQAPGLLDAQALLAEVRLAAGEADFASHYLAAARKHPQDPNIPAAHCDILAGLDHFAQAADIAAQARARFPAEPHFALLEAINAGSAGEWDRAEALFSKLPVDTPGRALHEARHRTRAGDAVKADALLEIALGGEPWDIAAWALRGIVWRLTDDPRADWLHEQAELVQFRPLISRAGRDSLIEDVVANLRDVHTNSAMPLGQSLRGGSQTRGILFERSEPLLAELHQAILATLESYRSELAPLDETHPLLRHREGDWRLAGSWSVRLTGGTGDHHKAHIHPQGIVSSALYLVVPDEARLADRKSGWLEIGRPPPDLGLDLPPIRTIAPEPGHLALFPSTLYHGTTPFGGRGPGAMAERITVAFDVTT